MLSYTCDLINILIKNYSNDAPKKDINFSICLVNKKPNSCSSIKGGVHTVLINGTGLEQSEKRSLIDRKLLLTSSIRSLFNKIKKNKLKLKASDCRYLFIPFERSYLCDIHLLVELLELQDNLSKANIKLIIEINNRPYYNCFDCKYAKNGFKFIKKKIDIIYTKKITDDFFIPKTL